MKSTIMVHSKKANAGLGRKDAFLGKVQKSQLTVSLKFSGFFVFLNNFSPLFPFSEIFNGKESYFFY